MGVTERESRGRKQGGCGLLTRHLKDLLYWIMDKVVLEWKQKRQKELSSGQVEYFPHMAGLPVVKELPGFLLVEDLIPCSS